MHSFLLPKLKFVDLNSQIGLNFNRFSINTQRWKNPISTRNHNLIRIFSILLQILQK